MSLIQGQGKGSSIVGSINVPLSTLLLKILALHCQQTSALRLQQVCAQEYRLREYSSKGTTVLYQQQHMLQPPKRPPTYSMYVLLCVHYDFYVFGASQYRQTVVPFEQYSLNHITSIFPYTTTAVTAVIPRKQLCVGKVQR